MKSHFNATSKNILAPLGHFFLVDAQKRGLSSALPPLMGFKTDRQFISALTALKPAPKLALLYLKGFLPSFSETDPLISFT